MKLALQGHRDSQYKPTETFWESDGKIILEADEEEEVNKKRQEMRESVITRLEAIGEKGLRDFENNGAESQRGNEI